ncbi:MAG: acyl carrier protein [Clostridia bacterium]|nr:acyl carrier protein [Clostridia bacterium]MDE6757959.1 acyl carrier protein [Clostridia bacterium]MDE7079618.1 acyl carrier protein [Clostridia bacterium]
MVLEKLSKIIADQLGMEQSKITKATLLKEELLADSLDIVEIIMSLEEEFGIQVDDNDALAFKTVGDVAEYIEKNI